MSEMMSVVSIWQFGPLLALCFAALILAPFWSIFKKAGYSQWLSLLMVVPAINLAMLYFVAFSDWPRLREKQTG